MTLYHGTNATFDQIDLLKSKPNKDFGLGFYLSDNYEQAMEMAKIKTEQLECGQPVVMTYEVNEEDVKKLQLKTLQFTRYDEEWAKFILMNRRNDKRGNVHDFDIVVGPIANDRVGVQLWKYESNAIDLPTLVKRLSYIKGVTIQYFFGTERAIKLLKRV